MGYLQHSYAMTRRAAIYARISRDREGAGLGVERQQDDCVALAERLGFPIVVTHVDNDMSAYSGKPRPGYRALLDQIHSGTVDVVLTWHTDRLHRSPVELEDWIAACEPWSVAVHTVKAGPLDLATPSGRLVARQLGAVARYEVEHAIERQKAAKAQAAAAGKWRGGRRPFGYEADGLTIRPDEAAAVLDATRRVLAGESLHSIAREMNERGLVTSTGRQWKPTELRKVLLRARNAGLIEHEGVEVGQAAWAPLVDPAAWRNLRRMLNAPQRRPSRSQDLRWLGSGVYECGVCGDGTTMLSATARTTSGGGRFIPSYRCRGGYHLTKAAEPVDAYISSIMVERLSRPDARRLLAPAAEVVQVESLHARRADVEARLVELAGLFAEHAITGTQLAEGTRTLRAEGEKIDAALDAATGHSPLAGIIDAPDVGDAWRAASVARRKAVIRSLARITLLKWSMGRPRGWKPGENYFNPDSVDLQWRQ